eukprot:5365854-Pleurochrysis_carterae.AAC.1
MTLRRDLKPLSCPLEVSRCLSTVHQRQEISLDDQPNNGATREAVGTDAGGVQSASGPLPSALSAAADGSLRILNLQLMLVRTLIERPQVQCTASAQRNSGF